MSTRTYHSHMKILVNCNLVKYIRYRRKNGQLGEVTIRVLNGTSFQLTPTKNHTAKICIVEVNHTAKKAQCGAPTIVGSCAHINTTVLEKQNINKKENNTNKYISKESKLSSSNQTLKSDSVKNIKDEVQSQTVGVITARAFEDPVSLDATPTPPDNPQDNPEYPMAIDPNFQYQEMLFVNHPYATQDEEPKKLAPVSGYSALSQQELATFEVFWNLYPRKTNKLKARSAWFHNGCHLKANAIIAKLKEQIAKDKTYDGYAPNPANYLNQERYNDEIYKGKNVTKGKTAKGKVDWDEELSSTDWVDRIN